MVSEEYISRDYLLNEYDRQHQGPPGGARRIIAEAPAADVVEVVRCRECKHLCVRSGALGVSRCAIHGDYPSDEYFCADGERKDGGQEPPKEEA